MNYTVLEGQSLLDIALIVSGSAESAFDLALENDLSITDDLMPGQILKFTGAPINKRIVEYYRNNNITPATAARFDEETVIGDMAIETNFVIE